MVVLVAENVSVGGRGWLFWWLRIEVPVAEYGCVGG